MKKPINLHDSTLLALWIVIWAYPNSSLEIQKQNRDFYEAAKRDLKMLYGIRMEDIKDQMEKEYGLKGPPEKWDPSLWPDNDDWKKQYV